jgi:hypothetical protein
LNLLLLNGQMSTQLRTRIVDGIKSVNLQADRGADKRVALAISLAMASPEYIVQK